MSEAADAAGPADAARAPGYAAFVAGVGSWFGAWGMQAVLFAWIVVNELAADPEWVGVAQFCMMLPTLVLLPVGGAVADRFDPRRTLIVLHGAAALPPIALGAALASGRLSLPGLLVYGVCMGTLAAFAMPARDTLLSRVAGTDMMRAVTGMTAIQFGAQASGSLLAGASRWLGASPVLGLQALVMAWGSVATRQVAPAAVAAGPESVSLGELTSGLREVAGSARLRDPILLTLAVGFLFIGPFLVIFPLILRDVYHGGVQSLSLLLMLFPLGTIAGSLLIRARGGVERKGAAALGALVFGALALGVIGLGLPFWGMVLATAAWGLGGAVFINSSRTLYQEAAPAEHRGRVLAVYQMGFMGAAPLGALCAGFASAQLGPLATLRLAAASMLLVTLAMRLLTSIARAR